MSPDFDEIVGASVTPEERAGLRRVHDLLVESSRAHPRSRRARPGLGTRAVLAGACVTAAAAAGGFALGHGTGRGFATASTRPMHGVGAARGATAQIRVGQEDAGGNLPIRMVVRRLPSPRQGRWYGLYLTERHRPTVECGIFRTGRSGAAEVRMTAPGDLDEYDGWVVTTMAAGRPAQILMRTG